VVFDIDGVVRDVGNSYRRALADTVEEFTQKAYRPSQADIDALKGEGLWNNDWEASQEMVYRFFERQGVARSQLNLDYRTLVTFFQRRYRGPDPENPNYDLWTGYIAQEPLLMSPTYLAQLTQAAILWGFFSGATRGSASYVLKRRLGLQSPALVAMEDAPGKPDPTGLLDTVRQLELRQPEAANYVVVYVGDTVADMQTVQNVRQVEPARQWIGVGVLPPHAQISSEYADAYRAKLKDAGAAVVLKHVEELMPDVIRQLVG
jgi:HAD superfamily phosphatase